jgi:hypothetical protein
MAAREGNTMENAFKAIQSGDEAAKAKASDFAERVTTGDPLTGFTDDEVQESAAILQQLTPEQRQRAMAASVQNVKTNMSDSERSSLNDMLKQRQAGRGMVDITRSGESVPAGTAAAEAGAAGGGAASIDDLLGGLLGGEGGANLDDLLGGLLGGGSSGSSQSGGGGIGGMLSGMLGGLLGGGAKAEPGAAQGGGDAGVADMLGDVMSSPAGKAIIAGAAAYAMKEILGQ